MSSSHLSRADLDGAAHQFPLLRWLGGDKSQVRVGADTRSPAGDAIHGEAQPAAADSTIPLRNLRSRIGSHAIPRYSGRWVRLPASATRWVGSIPRFRRARDSSMHIRARSSTLGPNSALGFPSRRPLPCACRSLPSLHFPSASVHDDTSAPPRVIPTPTPETERAARITPGLARAISPELAQCTVPQPLVHKLYAAPDRQCRGRGNSYCRVPQPPRLRSCALHQ